MDAPRGTTVGREWKSTQLAISGEFVPSYFVQHGKVVNLGTGAGMALFRVAASRNFYDSAAAGDSDTAHGIKQRRQLASTRG
jgi:hypothetical protein